MKTMFRFSQLCGAVFLLSCTTGELPPEKVGVTPTPPATVNNPVSPDNFSPILTGLYPFADSDRQFYIKEKISYTSSMNMDALSSVRMASPVMGELVKSGEQVNMVAIGGGMTAGFRNGGLYRAGQLTAYPNLVARQMGITDFQSPLFGENEANGTGYVQLVDDGSKYPTWREVTNNLAKLKAGRPPELPRYEGGLINNYAVPEGGIDVLFSNLTCDNCTFYNGKSWTNGMVFGSRISPGSVDARQVSLFNQIKKKPVNFFIAEDDFDKLMYMVKDNSVSALSNYGYDIFTLGRGDYPRNLKKSFEESGGTVKGVVFTYPIITDLALLNWYKTEELKDKAKTLLITYERNNQTLTLDLNSSFLLMPTSKVDTLFRNLKKGDNIKTILTNADVMDSQELHNNTYFIKRNNEVIKQSAKNSNLALVDLEKIYAQINTNTYVSNDGFKVTGGGRGNFFSSDGIYPSAIGQAVIANEVIKSINSTYKSNIPLINLNDYSKLVGKE
jgi:hypothetical protein